VGYWRDVFKEAWQETKESFGWTKKTAAVALIAVGTIIAALLRLGTAGMTETATGYFWIGLGPVFAGLVLFVWNFMEAQSKLYASQVRVNNALRSLLTEHDEPKPNYDAWRHVHELKIRKAACLWCDSEPRMTLTPKATAWCDALVAAVKKGELDFVPDYPDRGDRDKQRTNQQNDAWSETIVSRDHLRAFAKAHGYDPIFLRDA
jgi:hypothetical protein